MKTCYTCKQSKETSEYGNNKAKPDGLSHKCRDCDNLYNRKRDRKDQSKLFLRRLDEDKEGYSGEITLEYVKACIAKVEALIKEHPHILSGRDSFPFGW